MANGTLGAGAQPSKMDANRISFDELKAYWVKVDHFAAAGRKIREIVRTPGDGRWVDGHIAMIKPLAEF